MIVLYYTMYPNIDVYMCIIYIIYNIYIGDYKNQLGQILSTNQSNGMTKVLNTAQLRNRSRQIQYHIKVVLLGFAPGEVG